MEKERPGGVAVDHEHGLALALVEVVHGDAAEVDAAAGEGVEGVLIIHLSALGTTISFTLTDHSEILSPSEVVVVRFGI